MPQNNAAVLSVFQKIGRSPKRDGGRCLLDNARLSDRKVRTGPGEYRGQQALSSERDCSHVSWVVCAFNPTVDGKVPTFARGESPLG